jgi:hypothetical protein
MNFCDEPFFFLGGSMRLTRRVIAGTFIVLLLSAAALAQYVGSKNSDKYHKPTCTWAQKIKAENRVNFKNVKEAEKAGYIPCKVCRPPTSAQE